MPHLAVIVRGHLLRLEDPLQEVRMAITEAETINADLLAFIMA